jgi:hypothetical protein
MKRRPMPWMLCNGNMWVSLICLEPEVSKELVRSEDWPGPRFQASTEEQGNTD